MSKVEQGAPHHRDTKEIVKFARELGANFADSDWQVYEQFVDAAVCHAAASLPESHVCPTCGSGIRNGFNFNVKTQTGCISHGKHDQWHAQSKEIGDSESSHLEDAIVELSQELSKDYADGQHSHVETVKEAIRYIVELQSSIPLPESQPAPEMDADALVRQFCPVLSYTCEADRQQQHKARVNVAEEWLRAHDARVQPEVAVLIDALKSISDPPKDACGCDDHECAECCVNADYHCPECIAGHAIATFNKRQVGVQPTISLEVYQHDWVPGFAAFHEDGSIQEGARAHVVLNLGSLLCAVECGDLPKEDLPYMIAESLMHETIHALESWARVEFSEERVEALLAKYREKYAVEGAVWVHDSQLTDEQKAQPKSGAAQSGYQVSQPSSVASVCQCECLKYWTSHHPECPCKHAESALKESSR